jgi:hypothetical protein
MIRDLAHFTVDFLKISLHFIQLMVTVGFRFILRIVGPLFLVPVDLMLFLRISVPQLSTFFILVFIMSLVL